MNGNHFSTTSSQSIASEGATPRRVSEGRIRTEHPAGTFCAVRRVKPVWDAQSIQKETGTELTSFLRVSALGYLGLATTHWDLRPAMSGT